MPNRIKRLKNGLGLRLLFPLGLLGLVFAAYVVDVWRPYLLSHERTDYLRHQRALSATLADMLAMPLQNGDRSAIRASLDRVLELHHPLWLGLSLDLSDGSRLHRATKGSKSPDSGQIIQLVSPVMAGEQQLGTLRITIDLAPRLRHDTEATDRLAMAVLAGTGLALALAWLLLRLFVDRPLRQLARASAALSEGRYDTPVPSSGHDVIGQLGRRFEAMRTAMAAREDDLKRSEVRLRDLIETSPDWIWEVNAEGVYTYASPRVKDLLGYEPEEVLGRAPFEFMPEDEAVRVQEAFRQYVQERRSFAALENVNLRKDGRQVVLETSGVPFYDAAGELLGYRGVDRDITQRKIAEEQLRDLNKDLESRVLERTLELQNQKFALDQHSIVAITDQAGRITYVNDKFCHISGYSRKELLGQDHRIVNSGYHPKAFFKEIWRTIGKGQVWRGEICNRAKDGRTYWVDTSIVPFLDGKGKPRRYVSIRTDITERKNNEQALVKARNAAMAASRAKSEFLAVMSHEIRTPLNGILGMLELLEGAPDEETSRDYLTVARQSAERLMTLLADTLDFSRLDSGRVTLEKAPFSPCQLIDEVVTLMEGQAHGKGLTLRQAGSVPQEQLLEGDGFRIRQVVTNLLSNAIKFTDESGDILIACELLADSAKEAVLRVEVSDDGTGIPVDVLADIFEPFTQADSSTARKYGGSGLGLAICRNLVELMGGEIGVESEPGQGSTFWFTVPLSKPNPEERSAALVGESPGMERRSG